MSIIKNIYLEYTLLVVSGILYTCSFSPIDFKVGIFVSLGVYFYILVHSNRRSSAIKSYIYGLAIFSSGVSWIFNSIYYYGGELLIISILMTVIFILFMSTFFIPIGFFINQKTKIFRFYYPAIASSMWVLMEIIRSNIFGGFPWLLAGTSQTGTLFDDLYPLLGVYFVSFIVIMISMAIVIIICTSAKKYLLKIYSAIVLSLFLAVNFIPLNTSDAKEPLKITILQPNINLGIKFNKSQIDNIKNIYFNLLNNNINSLVVMPETAIPILYQLDKSFYEKTIKQFDIKLIAGIFNYNQLDKKVYNSILMLNNDDEFIYNKRHLVPFGEYTPLENIFGIIGDMLQIPMSNISHGSPKQSKMYHNDISIHPLICYEIAYPSLININDSDYGIILNISNDAWFGNSFAPHQHLQIAKVRALETKLPIIRAANTGISAVIDKKGVVINKIKLNQLGYINIEVYPSKGVTPYMYFGDYPLLMLIFSIILLYWKYYRKYG